MSFFKVDILTPSRVVAKAMPADSLIVPVDRGQIEILPNHTHIIEKLGTGRLTVKVGDNIKHFMITAGICKLLDNKVNIIANVCEPQTEIDGDRAEKARKLSYDKLTNSDDLSDDERVKYSRKIRRAEIRIMMASEQ